MRVAVLGATGLVGREMIKVLEERGFPVGELLPLASSRSAGQKVPFRGRDIVVEAVDESSFHGVDCALFSAGSDTSRTWAPRAASSGAVVIDNSSAWRMAPDVPLVVPEVNPKDLDFHRGIIANPNCATIQAVVALKPLHDAAWLESMSVVTFQSVSGTGRRGIEALSEGSKAVLKGEKPEAGPYTRPIAFDVLPEIGSIDKEGVSEEERKMINESRKIFHLPDLAVSCTTVRVPVFRGHAESIVAAFGKDVSPESARHVLREAPGVRCVDECLDGNYATCREAAGKDPVFVGRIRRDTGREKALSMWVVADNLRKGAALNAVQIAETLFLR